MDAKSTPKDNVEHSLRAQAEYEPREQVRDQGCAQKDEAQARPQQTLRPFHKVQGDTQM